jgi:hypothetical protein
MTLLQCTCTKNILLPGGTFRMLLTLLRGSTRQLGASRWSGHHSTARDVYTAYDAAPNVNVNYRFTTGLTSSFD